jgi:hypothetical protein
MSEKKQIFSFIKPSRPFDSEVRPGMLIEVPEKMEKFPSETRRER